MAVVESEGTYTCEREAMTKIVIFDEGSPMLLANAKHHMLARKTLQL